MNAIRTGRRFGLMLAVALAWIASGCGGQSDSAPSDAIVAHTATAPPSDVATDNTEPGEPTAELERTPVVQSPSEDAVDDGDDDDHDL